MPKSYAGPRQMRHGIICLTFVAWITCIAPQLFAMNDDADLPRRPNIVLIVSDDQGYGDLGCHGNPVLKTPALDRLYEDSVRLTDFHVAPTCSPTRAALMTGRNKLRTGVWHTIQGRNLMRQDERTIGNIFQAAGYRTALFGKWHLGDNVPLRPEDRGFGHVVCHRGGGVGQTPDVWNNAYFDDTYFVNSVPTQFAGYCTDIWFDEAWKFMAPSTNSGPSEEEAVASEGKPFLALICTNAPHGPFHRPEKYAVPYADQKPQVRDFFGMIANLDQNVGKLRKRLEDSGMMDNTVFIFMTDNGTSSGDKVFNASMRGKKGSQFEGGHRVPCFIHAPSQATSGRDIDQLTTVTDIVPTLMDLCGIENKDQIAFDGLSLKPLISGSDLGSDIWADRVVITDSQRIVDPVKWRKSATMMQHWRLIDGKELYDLRADPSQKKDVSNANPEVFQKLRTAYEDFWAEVSPTFSQDVRVWIGDDRENPTELTCHDWITSNPTPWNQQFIRTADTSIPWGGYWNLDVREAGDYLVRLSRWPASVDAPLTASLKAAPKVPGGKTYRANDGNAFDFVSATLRVGDLELSEKYSGAGSCIEFEVELPQGPTELNANFLTSDGNTIGAFYVTIEKR